MEQVLDPDPDPLVLLEFAAVEKPHRNEHKEFELKKCIISYNI